MDRDKVTSDCTIIGVLRVGRVLFVGKYDMAGRLIHPAQR